MNKNLINFKGLYGENSAIDKTEFIYSESLETRSSLYNWEIKEHLHADLIQIFIFVSGEGLFISENKKIAIKAPSVLFISANTLHGFAFQSNISGEVLTFSEVLQDSVFKNAPQLSHELNKLKQFEFETEKSSFEEILLIQKKMAQELKTNKPQKQLAIHALLHLFFIHLFRCNPQTDAHFIPTDNRTLAYFQEFQKLVKKSFLENKSIGAYAKNLGISSVHLNRVCQTVANKSALQIIQENIIHEAKKYILNTSYSISEISYFLEFKDPAYFTRLFKKQTGISPSGFRNQESGIRNPS